MNLVPFNNRQDELQKLVMVYWGGVDFTFQELIINALLYDEILIKDETLVLNSTVIEYLNSDENFEIFKELLKTGIVKILTLPEIDYPKDSSKDPATEPIAARADEISRRKTLNEMEWVPPKHFKKFYKRLDDFLATSNLDIIRGTRPLPREENQFAASLTHYLKNRNRYQLNDFPEFKGISDQVADVLIKCCEEPRYWIQFLHEKGRPTTKTGQEGKFFRSGAYQVLDTFPQGPHAQSTKNLIQSVFNSGYCDNEGAAGKWGGNLIEPPYLYSSPEEYSEASSRAKRIEIVTSDHLIKFPKSPDIGEVIVKTKEQAKSKDLLDFLFSEGNKFREERSFFFKEWGRMGSSLRLTLVVN